MVWLHLQTVTSLYGLDGNNKLLEIYSYPSNNHTFYRPELNLENRVLHVTFRFCLINVYCKIQFSLQLKKILITLGLNTQMAK